MSKRHLLTRLGCAAGALYVSLSTPVALVFGKTKLDIVPQYLRPVSHVEALSEALPPEVAQVPVPVPPAPPTPPPACGVYHSPDYYQELVIQRESGGQTCVYNSIGACGLFQALPCSKLGCVLSDVACQLAWGTSYMLSNYGSWASAWNHEVTMGWW